MSVPPAHLKPKKQHVGHSTQKRKKFESILEVWQRTSSDSSLGPHASNNMNNSILAPLALIGVSSNPSKVFAKLGPLEFKVLNFVNFDELFALIVSSLKPHLQMSFYARIFCFSNQGKLFKTHRNKENVRACI